MNKPKKSPEELRLLSALGAEVSWSNTSDPVARTKAARDAAFQRFVDEVDPHRRLSVTERIRRAKHARRAHMIRIALKSAEARRELREALEWGEVAEP